MKTKAIIFIYWSLFFLPVVSLNAQIDKNFIDYFYHSSLNMFGKSFDHYNISTKDDIDIDLVYNNDSNRLLSIASLSDWQKNGPFIQFYNSGKIKLLMYYYHSYPIGLMAHFYESGKIKSLYNWGTIEEAEELRKENGDRRKRLYDEVTGEEIGDTIAPMPIKNECIEYYENGCIKRIIIYKEGICEYCIYYNENEFLINKEKCLFENTFCDFDRVWSEF